MLTVGLTGNIAAGKSVVARVWSSAGIPVLSADDVVHSLLALGGAGVAPVSERFGHEVLASDGGVDRAALRQVVFGDAEARSLLESILHPLVRQERNRWMAEQETKGSPIAVAEIPLLFEVGLEGEFDRVVLVDAPEELRLSRIVENRGLDPEVAKQMIESQMDAAEKRDRAHYVIENRGSVDGLETASTEVLHQLRDEVSESTPAWDAGALLDPSQRLRLDLHTHTKASWDSRSDPYALRRVALSRGIGRFAITDHNRLGEALEMAAEFPDEIIPGEEVKTAEGVDVIGLYLHEEIPKGTPALETCHRIKEQGGIVYLPHPFAKGKGGDGRLAETLQPLLDVIEGFNARVLSPERNRRAVEFAGRHGLPQGVGTDAHTVGEIGLSFVDTPMHPNRPEALLAALADGRPSCRPASRLVFIGSNWAKIRKKLPGG